MRAPTIFLGLFRIGAYLLPPASSFQTHHHHHHPSAAASAASAASASVRRDGGAIIAGTMSKGGARGASSNHRDDEVDHPDDDGRAAAAFAGGGTTTSSRRSFAEDAMAKVSTFLGSSLLVARQQPTSPAHASGGATAGGAYLLSGTSGSEDRLPYSCQWRMRDAQYSNLTLALPAKQRYNKRVLAGIKSFLTLDARWGIQWSRADNIHLVTYLAVAFVCKQELILFCSHTKGFGRSECLLCIIGGGRVGRFECRRMWAKSFRQNKNPLKLLYFRVA
jgi:hypothetical protein